MIVYPAHKNQQESLDIENILYLCTLLGFLCARTKQRERTSKETLQNLFSK